MPAARQDEFNTFHTFVIQAERRDDLQRHLRAIGIKTAIHYPVPIHLQPAAASLGYRKATSGDGKPSRTNPNPADEPTHERAGRGGGGRRGAFFLPLDRD